MLWSIRMKTARSLVFLTREWFGNGSKIHLHALRHAESESHKFEVINLFNLK